MLLMASVFETLTKIRGTFRSSNLAIPLSRSRPVPPHPDLRAFTIDEKCEKLEDCEWSNPGVTQETFSTQIQCMCDHRNDLGFPVM